LTAKLGAANKRGFSIELDSGSDLKRLSVPNGTQRILMEGTIGALKRVEFVEDSVLELVGSNGVLRVDLSREDLSKPPTRLQRGWNSRFLTARLERSGKGSKQIG
jgi:hypothetical protein